MSCKGLRLREDDAEIRKATVPFLERRVGRVVVATNGREGLERFSVQPVDLVVTDVLMPELDGLDMADAIRARAPHVPVIMVTAFERSDFMRRAIEIIILARAQRPHKAAQRQQPKRQRRWNEI